MDFVVNKHLQLNVSTEVRIERIFGRSHQAELSVRTFAFTLEADHTVAHKTPFVVKEERACFTVTLGSKEEC